MEYKYMRIQGRENSYVTKYPKGIFSLCWNLIRDEQLTNEKKHYLYLLIAGSKIIFPNRNLVKTTKRSLHFLNVRAHWK